MGSDGVRPLVSNDSMRMSLSVRGVCPAPGRGRCIRAIGSVERARHCGPQEVSLVPCSTRSSRRNGAALSARLRLTGWLAMALSCALTVLPATAQILEGGTVKAQHG